MIRKNPLMIGGAIALLGAAAVLAQTVDGLDLGAVQKKGDAVSEDAAAFVNDIKRRSDALAQDARETAAGGAANQQRYAEAQGKAEGASELDTMMASVSAKTDTGDAPLFIVFASLSMPPESLKPLIRDTSKAGGAVVFQGFPGNSMKAFQQGITKVIEPGQETKSLGIDPRLFRAFNVTSVPAFVVVTSDFDLCDGLTCRTTPPPHDRMSGNITVRYVLETFATGGGPGARIAATALKQLDAGS
jgi:conjugal transfer pilus assembly protein TrbC